jgi:hypothetical protein
MTDNPQEHLSALQQQRSVAFRDVAMLIEGDAQDAQIKMAEEYVKRLDDAIAQHKNHYSL